MKTTKELFEEFENRSKELESLKYIFQNEANLSNEEINEWKALTATCMSHLFNLMQDSKLYLKDKQDKLK